MSGIQNRKALSDAASSIRHTIHADDDQPIAHIVSAPILTRDILAAGGAIALAANDDPTAHLHSESERAASLDAFTASRPTGDVWIFAYGSLIWNPALNIAERRIGRVQGWHRTFCLSMTAGRGTAAHPGLALGLDQGGECLGVAYRIAADNVSSELPLLWSREMLLGGYIPQWVEIADADGEAFGHAITFTIDARHRHYAGDISPRATVQRLATAVGSWGSAADYLFRSIAALREHNIYDADLEKVGALVEAALLLSIWPKAA
jgi:glutathione-specific gamma-glutamylcyclotransferase